jgi:quercetin dioxygenase-like cupin family protein
MSNNPHPGPRGAVMSAAAVVVEPQTWGRLEWMVSGALGNSDVLTMGKCFIRPGENNPVHHHPNCDEVLHVIRGRIRHRISDDHVEMSAGDTVSIPQGAWHNAVNIGDDECELLITYNTAHREVIGE